MLILGFRQDASSCLSKGMSQVLGDKINKFWFEFEDEREIVFTSNQFIILYNV
jgi:hypothetical protein